MCPHVKAAASLEVALLMFADPRPHSLQLMWSDTQLTAAPARNTGVTRSVPTDPKSPVDTLISTRQSRNASGVSVEGFLTNHTVVLRHHQDKRSGPSSESCEKKTCHFGRGGCGLEECVKAFGVVAAALSVTDKLNI